MRQKFINTPLRGYTRSKSLVGFNLVSDDVVELWVERLVANGFRAVGTLDTLFDVDNMILSLKRAKELGAYAFGALVFCESPVHTDEVYAHTARALVERADVDAIMIKDSGALLTPDRVRTLIPALREAVKLGVDQLHTAIAPLASGPAQPSIQNTIGNLDTMGVHTRIDRDAIDSISTYLAELAEREGKPVGKPQEYEAFHYQHQMPGGMLENWRFQLEQAGLLDRFDEILEEIARVRAELAGPIMVTPFSQIVAVQAMMNVVKEERYEVVADEVKLYALGHFGKLLAPVDGQVLDRIVENGSPDIPLKPRTMPETLPGMRKRFPRADDDELLLRCMFAGKEVDEMLAASPMAAAPMVAA